jgi:hypothetical protein
VACEQHVAGDPGPHQTDHRAAAVRGVHAGAAGLHECRSQPVEAGQVELTFGVQPPGLPRPLRYQHPIGADDLTGGLVAHDEVVAVPVKVIDVQAGHRAA